MNVLDEAQWATFEPLVRRQCPRLTPADLRECQRRVDLLTAKIQNRHWMERIAAQRVVLGLLQQAGLLRVA